MRTFVGILLGLCTVTAVFATLGCGSHDSGSLPTASIGDSTDATSHPAKHETDRLHPVVQIHTTQGDITLKLDAEHAPITVDNFLAYVEQGHYDNTLIHQISTQPAAILGGGYDTFQKEKPTGVPIRNEAHNGLKNVRGTIGMARRGDSIDSSTSQFYINLADNPSLDHQAVGKDVDAAHYGYCVFGEVTAGLDVADQIGKVAMHDVDKFKSIPVEPVIVKWVHIVQ